MSRLGKIRRENIKRRKNFLPTLLLTIFAWIVTLLIIFFLKPTSALIICLFFLAVFLTLFLTLSIIVSDTKKGAIISGGLFLFLVLRFFGVGNFLNLILIAGLSIALYTFAK